MMVVVWSCSGGVHDGRKHKLHNTYPPHPYILIYGLTKLGSVDWEGIYAHTTQYVESTLLKMGRYYNTTLCHYWDMSVK